MEVMRESVRAGTQGGSVPCRDNGLSEMPSSGVLCRNAVPFLTRVRRHVWGGTSWRKGSGPDQPTLTGSGGV